MHTRLASALLAALLAATAAGCGSGSPGGADRLEAVEASLDAAWSVQVDTTERTVCVDDGGDRAFLCRVTWKFEDLHPHRQLRLDLSDDNRWKAETTERDGSRDVRLRGCLSS